MERNPKVQEIIENNLDEVVAEAVKNIKKPDFSYAPCDYGFGESRLIGTVLEVDGYMLLVRVSLECRSIPRHDPEDECD